MTHIRSLSPKNPNFLGVVLLWSCHLLHTFHSLQCWCNVLEQQVTFGSFHGYTAYLLHNYLLVFPFSKSLPAPGVSKEGRNFSGSCRLACAQSLRERCAYNLAAFESCRALEHIICRPILGQSSCKIETVLVEHLRSNLFQRTGRGFWGVTKAPFWFQLCSTTLQFSVKSFQKSCKCYTS